MRGIALAAVMGVSLVAGGVAVARPWNDPNGRVNFDAPAGWIMEVRRASPQTIVLAGSADNECFVLATPNSVTANATPDRVRRTADPLAPDAWTTAANSVAPMFPSRSAQLTSQTVDTSGFWPVQRAEFSGATRPVTAALQSRPGIDLMAFCWTYGGGDASATYDALFRSMAHPNDATWQAQAQQQVSDREAQAAANAAAATPSTEEAETAEQPAQPAPRRRVTPNLRDRTN